MTPSLRQPPTSAPIPLQPWGAYGPFGGELACDGSGPALQATVEYRMREGVATHSGLLLPNHRPRAFLGLGYGNTLLAQLVPAPRPDVGLQLRLTDLTQPTPPAPQNHAVPPHIQRLGFGLTHAVPGDAKAASWPKSTLLATFFDLPATGVELLRAEFVPGDQRPQALIFRQPSSPPNEPPTFTVTWLDLAPVWRKYGAGVGLGLSQLDCHELASNARWPQVLTNMGGADDAGRTFVLAEGEDFDVGEFGSFVAAQVSRLRAFAPPPGPHMPPKVVAESRQAGRLSGVACAPNGWVAWCLNGQVQVHACDAERVYSRIHVPTPVALARAAQVAAIHLQFAAQGRLLTASMRGQVGRADGANWVTRAGLFVLDLPGARAVPVKVPTEPAADGLPGVNAHYQSLCFAGCDIDAVDAARLLELTAPSADKFGGRRLVRSVRRLWQGEQRRVSVYVGAMFGNITQLWRLELNPTDPNFAAYAGNYKVANMAQSFSMRRRPNEAHVLWEYNDHFLGQVYPSGSPKLFLSLDRRRWLMPRFYGEIDQERDNGRLSGGIKYFPLAETRPEVVAAAAEQQLTLRAHKVTMGPWMSRDGRWMFAGLDGDRLQRWDFAAEENGWLMPGTHEPRLTPAYERARTPNFMVTPLSRYSLQPFIGHRHDEDTPGVDPWPLAEDRLLRRSAHPRPPRLMEQTAGAGLRMETSNAELAAVRAESRQVDVPSWGSADHDRMEAQAAGESRIKVERLPFPLEFEREPRREAPVSYNSFDFGGFND